MTTSDSEHPGGYDGGMSLLALPPPLTGLLMHSFALNSVASVSMIGVVQSLPVFSARLPLPSPFDVSNRPRCQKSLKSAVLGRDFVESEMFVFLDLNDGCASFKSKLLFL